MANLGSNDTDGEFQEVSADVSRTNSRTVTINVPSDFGTVSSAFDEIREIRTPPGVKFEVLIESGHAITEPIPNQNEDFRHVELTSEDAIVPVDSTFPDGEHIIDIAHARSFMLGTKIDAQGNGDRGVNINPGVFRSRGQTSVGVINAAGRGFSATNASVAIAYQNDYSGAGSDCAFVGPASIVSFGRDTGSGRPNLSGAGENGINASRGAVVRAADADLSNCGGEAIRADQAATVYAGECIGTGAGGDGIFASNGAIVTAPFSDFSNPGSNCVSASRMSFVNLRGATLQNGGNGAISSQGSVINVDDATVTGNTQDLNVIQGGKITAQDCETTTSTGVGPHETDANIRGFDEENGIIHGNFESA